MTLVSVSDQIYVPLLLLPGLMGMLPRCHDKFWSQLAIKYHYQVKVAGNTLKSCTKHTNFYHPQGINNEQIHCHNLIWFSLKL